MHVLIPFSPGLTDYAALAAAFKKCGILHGHSLRVISNADFADAAYDFGSTLSDLFDKATFHGITMPDGVGNTTIANSFFKAAAEYVREQKTENGEPDTPVALYLNPLERPTRTGWLKELQSAYYFAGAPAVFGVRDVLADGQTSVPRGSIVFSKAFVTKAVLLNYLNRETHWRIYLSSELFKDFAPTDLIGDSKDAVLRPESKPKATTPKKP